MPGSVYHVPCLSGVHSRSYHDFREMNMARRASERFESRTAFLNPGLCFNKAMNSGASTALETGNSRLQFNSNNRSLPLQQRPEDRGLCLYELFLCALGGTLETTPKTPHQQNGVPKQDEQTPAAKNMCMLRSGNNTPEEATAAETKTPRSAKFRAARLRRILLLQR